MDVIDLCVDVTVLRTSGEGRGHEGRVEEDEERRLEEGKRDTAERNCPYETHCCV